jgi:hypothetical protein
MAKLSKTLKGTAKVKNHRCAKAAKAEIRRNVLEAIGSAAKVLDAFAGSGEMYRAAWSDAADYVGCDTKWERDDRPAFVVDNRRLLRSIDLKPYTIFDLDSFGSPWEQAIIIAARRQVNRGERIGMVLTEGSGLKLKMGGLPRALAEIAGLSGKISGMGRWQDDVINRAISGLAERMQCEIESRWEARRPAGASMRYIGLVLCGIDRHERLGAGVA